MRTFSRQAPAVKKGLVIIGLAALAAPASAQADTLYRVMNRATFGFTPAEYDAAKALGVNAYLQQQLVSYAALAQVENQVVGKWTDVDKRPDFLNGEIAPLSPPQQDVREREIVDDLKEARVWRAINSDRKAFERATWFWANHFSTDVNKRLYVFMPWFDEVVNRGYALGNFRDMLHASAGDDGTTSGATAMLSYLDNQLSDCGSGGEPNENYARELMELHALGAGSGVYSEADVKALARGLSGWGGNFTSGPDFLMFEFKPGLHCSPTGLFLGQQVLVLPGLEILTGQTMIDTVLDATLPGGSVNATASFIAGKLVDAFLTDVPPNEATSAQQVFINSATQDAIAAYAAADAAGSDTHIADMLTAILNPAYVDGVVSAGAGEFPAYKYKVPLHFVTSTLKAVDAFIDINQVNEIVSVIDGMGQRAFEFPAPTGYPEEIASWADGQISRWIFSFDMFRPTPTPAGQLPQQPRPFSTIPGVNVNVNALYNSVGGFNRSQCAEQAAYLLTGGDRATGGAITRTNMDPADVSIIQDYVNNNPQIGNFAVKWRVLALTTAAPSFSLY